MGIIMDKDNMIFYKSEVVVKNVEVVTLKNGVQTKRTLSGEELKEWKKEHGYADTENESQSDTDRETDSDTRESE